MVNCTGAWGPYISEMAGVDCPLVPFRHAYVVTENIPGTVIDQLITFLSVNFYLNL